jgi:LmbE family N-acetylglucosaminyl deacetylase
MMVIRGLQPTVKERTVASPDKRTIVVLSPHLDDAVFGLWHVLAGAGIVEVHTVFAGIPEPGFTTALDRSHGATESAAWMRRRRSEDAYALLLAGRHPTHLDLLDIQYLVHGDPALAKAVERKPSAFVRNVRAAIDLDRRVDEIEQALPPAGLASRLVYAPVSFGGHPDHRAVTRYAIRLAAAGVPVRLWADSPYYVRHGLPTWLGGVPNRSADDIIEEGLASCVGDGFRLRLDTVWLTGEALERKLAATRAYRTEYDSIAADFGPAMARDLLAYEAVWSLDADAKPVGG